MRPTLSIEQAARQAAESLLARGETLATAESCTGGLLAKSVTDLPGASALFPGGVVTYANSAKTALLGVRPETLAARGAVSEVVALEMAAGVCAALGADIGLSTTGIAGPGGGSAEKPVGLVFVGYCDPNGARAYRLDFPLGLSRDEIRRRTVRFALTLVPSRGQASPDEISAAALLAPLG